MDLEESLAIPSPLPLEEEPTSAIPPPLPWDLEPPTVVLAPLVPHPAKDRLLALDVCRGIAICGILAVNIGSFSMIEIARRMPQYGGGTDPLNFGIWQAIMLLADTKFIAMFSILFGAGIALLTNPDREGGSLRAPAYYRRMIFLMFIGYLHGHYLWFGDILFVYGAYGCLLFPLRRLPGPVLLLLGMAAVGFDAWMFGWSYGRSFDPWDAHYETQAALAGWAEQAPWREGMARRLETEMAVFFAPQGVGYMLLGIGLARMRVLTGQCAIGIYLAMAFLLPLGVVTIGLPSNWCRMLAETAIDDKARAGAYWGSLMVTFGWFGIGILLSRWFPRFAATRALAAMGRMALTNYLMQSLICTTIFYGFGFGMFGQMDRAGQVKVVVAIWIFQLLLSSAWFRWFEFGPVEWAWRLATYLRVPPLRKIRAPDLPVQAAVAPDAG